LRFEIIMGEELLASTALHLTIGILTHNIGQVVDSLVTLGLSVKHCKEKCDALIEKATAVAGAINHIEDQQKRDPQRFSAEVYVVSLEKFLTVVKDCHSLVKRYTKKNFVLRWLLALKFEGDFDSLDARMDKAMKLFDFDMQVEQNCLAYDRQDDLQIVKAQMAEAVAVIKALSKDELNAEESRLLMVDVGDSIYEGFMLAGLLEDSVDVILVASERGKKEAAIMKRLSDCDNILRFYGTFFLEGTKEYLVMERPGKEIRTLYDWTLEGHRDEWRLKCMMAQEIAMGLAYAHVAGVVHKNLRSANVFLTDESHPKLFAFFKGRVKSEPSEKKWTEAEQLKYAAPEMLTRLRPPYNYSCDIFSLGVIIWELIPGELPFSQVSSTTHLLKARVQQKLRLQFPENEANIPFLSQFMQISRDCMEDLPQNRPSINDIVDRLSMLAPEEMVVKPDLSFAV
jgi:serine/threonine protein kinase